MLRYSVLWEDEDYIYVEIICDTYKSINRKIPVRDYAEWKKDKVEY